MRPKYLLKKSDRRCTFTQLANTKYDSVTFSIRIIFEQVSKQRLKVKNSLKRLLNAIFWLDFLQRTSRYRLSLSSFCSKHLTSNRCISGLPCPITMQFLSSESTFQALNLILTFEAIITTLKVESKVKQCHFLAIRVCLKSYFAAVLNELQVPFQG